MTEYEIKGMAKALNKARFFSVHEKDLFDTAMCDQWHACVNAVCAVLKQNIVLFDSEQFRQECGQYD